MTHYQNHLKRINHQYDLNLNYPDRQYALILDRDNIYKSTVVLLGPQNTPYEGGKFIVNFELPKEYPFKPPKCRFVTPILHINIDEKGKTCIDILDEHWSPALTIRVIIRSLLALLTDPNPEDSLNLLLTSLYKNNREEYFLKVKEHTALYAK